jgi:hypothetical protein
MEKRGERRGGYSCIFAEWLGVKSSFQVSFRPSPPTPYARGDRRRTVGYARYSAGVAVGSEASLSAHPKPYPPHSPPPFPSSLSPILWRLAGRGGMEQAEVDIREGERQIRWRRGGMDPGGRPVGAGGLPGRGRL